MPTIKIDSGSNLKHLNRPIPSKGTELVILKLPPRKDQAQMASLVNSTKHRKRIHMNKDSTRKEN